MQFHPLSELFPLLEGAAFEELVADIKANGQRELITVLDDQVLDGRNRWRACERLQIKPKTRPLRAGDPLKYVISLNLHRRHLSESQRSMVAARMETFKHGGARRGDIQDANLRLEKVTREEAAALCNVSARSVLSASQVLASGTPELLKAVDQGELAVSDAAAIAQRPAAEQAAILEEQRASGRNLKAIARAHDVAAQREDIAAGKVSLPAGTFDCLVLDPPWPYRASEEDNDYDPQGNRAACPYPEMTLPEIEALPVFNLAAPDCALWLWTTHQFLPDAFPLIKAWGFEYKVALTWVKDRMGLGRWLRSRSEYCLLAVRGSPGFHLTNQTTVLEAPMREHSRKPDEFYSMVEELCVSVRRLDYFSREQRPGWHQVGNDMRKFA